MRKKNLEVRRIVMDVCRVSQGVESGVVRKKACCEVDDVLGKVGSPSSPRLYRFIPGGAIVVGLDPESGLAIVGGETNAATIFRLLWIEIVRMGESFRID